MGLHREHWGAAGTFCVTLLALALIPYPNPMGHLEGHLASLVHEASTRVM